MNTAFSNFKMNIKWGYVLVILIIAYPIFGHLDHLTIQRWDESRNANNALEMYMSHDLIVTTYNGEPDLWNTKPPLLIWLQVLFLHLFGLNEIAIRFPSAIAAFLSCSLLYFFCAKKMKSPLMGLACVLILITSQGYVNMHGTRTGDYDSLLCLFLLGQVIFFWLFLNEDKTKWLYFTFLCITLAVLTKGVAGLFFAPSLFLFSFYKFKIVSILKNKHFYMSVLISCLLIFGYYYLRGCYNDGYIKAVLHNEVGGRFNNAREGHEGHKWYYYDWLTKDGFNPWYLLVLPGLVCGLFSRNIYHRKTTILVSIIVIQFLFTISNAGTKLWWYAMPAIPLMALVCANTFYTLIEFVKKISIQNTAIFSSIFLLIVFYKPYKEILEKVNNPQVEDYLANAYFLNLYLKDIQNGKIAAESNLILWDSSRYLPETEFYLH